MGSRIVQQPNSLYARFSENVDDFTHYNMTAEEATLMWIQEYGMGKVEASEKVQQGIDAGLARWQEAIDIIKTLHGEQEAKSRVRELSEGPSA